MGFIDTLKERAKANVKTIVLPETEDKRTLAATEKILKEGIAKVILVGNEEAVKKSAAEDGYDISGAQIVDPATSEKTQGYIDKLVELRQKKGMTPDQATLESIKESVSISNRFFAIGTVAAIVVGVFMAYIVARNMTRPIST